MTKFDLFTSDAKLHQFDNDLKVVNGDMYFIAKQNISEGFACTIKNGGQMAVPGAEYTVKLMEAPDTELASVSGVDLASLEETSITVTHTFTTLSENRLFFKIEYAADEYLVNNTFREANVSVVPNSVEIKAIGSLGFPLSTPFSAGGSTQSLGEDDLTEAMYYNNELNSSGYVYGIAYKYNNLLDADKVVNYPLKVWVTQTSSDNLQDGWTPNEDLVLVFDGVVEILPGDNRDLYIPFNVPVLINGQENIVIRSYQYDPEWPPAILRFLGENNTTGNIRTIGALDVFDLDPDNPPSDFFQSQVLNYVQFIVDPITETTILSGVVYDNETNIPLADASISIEGSTITGLTDANGSYVLPALPFGTYNLTVSADVYLDGDLELEFNASTQTQDFYLVPLPELEVSGHVFGSNAPTTPLEFVNVTISKDGAVMESTTTDNTGAFLFPLVYGGSDYELTVFLYGYDEVVIPFSGIDTNIDFGDIILSEEFISPFDVQLDSESDPTVTWKSPKLSSKVKLKYDLNVESNGYANEPNEDVWLGNYYLVTELTTITSVEIQTSIYQGVEDFVTIDIFDLNSMEIIASSEPFLILQNATQVIDVPNIVVNSNIMVAVHWQNNPETTNYLSVDYSDVNIFDGAVIRFPDELPNLLSSIIGVSCSFLLRVNTLDDGSPTTNGEAVTYNIYRGLASEFPDTSNWDLLNSQPLSDLSFIDADTGSLNPNEVYRYAVETIYNNGVSEVTFSNSILGGSLSVGDFQYINSRISVYPIPTKDRLTVTLDPSLKMDQYMQIYDITGKHVSSISPSVFDNNRTIIDVQALQSGMYFLKLNVEGVSITKKFQVN